MDLSDFLKTLLILNDYFKYQSNFPALFYTFGVKRDPFHSTHVQVIMGSTLL